MPAGMLWLFFSPSSFVLSQCIHLESTGKPTVPPLQACSPDRCYILIFNRLVNLLLSLTLYCLSIDKMCLNHEVTLAIKKRLLLALLHLLFIITQDKQHHYQNSYSMFLLATNASSSIAFLTINSDPWQARRQQVHMNWAVFWRDQACYCHISLPTIFIF